MNTDNDTNSAACPFSVHRTIFHYFIDPFKPNYLVLPKMSKLLYVQTIEGKIRLYVEQIDTRKLPLHTLVSWANSPDLSYDTIKVVCYRAGMEIAPGGTFIGHALLRDGACRNAIYFYREKPKC